MYTRSKEGARILLGVYVDDLIITGTSTTAIGEFKTEMMNLFKMSDLGDYPITSASRWFRSQVSFSFARQLTRTSCSKGWA